MIDSLIIFCASILIWVMLGGVFLLWILDGRIKREAALHALVSAVFAFAFAEMIKSFFPMPRPFVQDGISATVLIRPGDASFPSGHSAAAAAMAITVWIHNKKWGAIYLISTFLIGVARIMGNVHFPLDVLAGVSIGFISAFLIAKTHFFKVDSQT